jgi:intracellular multiplication protein IcmP
MPPQQQGSQDPGTSDFVWIAIILIGGVFLAWYFGNKYIANFIYQIRLYEVQGIQLAIKGWNIAAVKLHLPFLKWESKDLTALANTLSQKKLAATFDAVQNMSTKVGDYLRFVITPLLAIFGVLVYATNVQLKLKTTFDLKRMRFAERNNWPQITPVLKLNLVKEDIDVGPWAMAETPMDFCKKHKLLKEKTDERGKPAVELLPEKAYQIFVGQLGPLWTHVLALPSHAKALFAILAACGNHDRDAAFELLSDISRSAGSGQSLNFAGTDQLLAKHFNTKLVIRVLQRHAYVTTIFIAMLELARTDGVLATSEFLWLKPLDRRLWYVLNTVGRHTSVPEVSGPYAHWLAEKKWGGPLRTPMMEEAVKAMESALADILYDPEND